MHQTVSSSFQRERLCFRTSSCTQRCLLPLRENSYVSGLRCAPNGSTFLFKNFFLERLCVPKLDIFLSDRTLCYRTSLCTQWWRLPRCQLSRSSWSFATELSTSCHLRGRLPDCGHHFLQIVWVESYAVTLILPSVRAMGQTFCRRATMFHFTASLKLAVILLSFLHHVFYIWKRKISWSSSPSVCSGWEVYIYGIDVIIIRRFRVNILRHS